MTWQPGQPIATAQDAAEWQAWKRARKIEGQRYRRKQNRRIDYYPGSDAQRIIDARTFRAVGGDFSSVIDALVLAGAGELPE